MKRVFGPIEIVFDALYLTAALVIGLMLIITSAHESGRVLSGMMALVLGVGDCFHLIPRIAAIATCKSEALRSALGRGKQITSITMAVFYLLLWQLGRMVSPGGDVAFISGLVWLLTTVRILLCLLPQNRWQEPYPPIRWGIRRNIPFFLLGAVVACRFFLERNAVPALHYMWLAITLSFVFYFPVVLWSHRSPKVGMLMLPKTCAYLWMLVMFVSL